MIVHWRLCCPITLHQKGNQSNALNLHCIPVCKCKVHEGHILLHLARAKVAVVGRELSWTSIA